MAMNYEIDYEILKCDEDYCETLFLKYLLYLNIDIDTFDNEYNESNDNEYYILYMKIINLVKVNMWIRIKNTYTNKILEKIKKLYKL